MAEFASNGKANAALTTGIIGTAGAGLEILNNLFSGTGIFGGRAAAPAAAAPNQMTDAAAIAAMAAAVAANSKNGTCNEDHVVTRYEAGQAAKIAELETEIKLRDANTYTDGKILDVYKYVDGRLRDIEGQLCEQRTYNATNTAAIACLQGQVAQLQSLTKLVVPNSSVCPGWGNVTITPTTTTAA